MVILVSRLYSIPILYNSAAGLRAWDRANGEMFEWLPQLRKSSHILFNYPVGYEYNYQMGLLLGLLYNRTDITFGSISDPQGFLQKTKVGDMVLLTFGAPDNYRALVRGVQLSPLEYVQRTLSTGTFGLEIKQVFSKTSQAKLLLPFSLETVPFEIGWLGYRILKLPDAILTTYGDGWMGRDADLWIAGRDPATVILSGEAALRVLYPIQISVWEDANLLGRFAINHPGAINFAFRTKPVVNQNVLRLKISADKTYIPAREGLGTDVRELSVILNQVQVIRDATPATAPGLSERLEGKPEKRKTE